MIKHVLKDGTILDDISGHVVRMNDVGEFYEILGRIQKGECYETKFGEEKNMQFLA